MKNGPCVEGEGHCRRDSDCADGLKCGRRNCKKDFTATGTKWKKNSNCCFSKPVFNSLLSLIRKIIVVKCIKCL